MTALPDRGRLGILPFPVLLLLLQRERFSGCLTLQHDPEERIVELSGGRPVQVRAGAREPGLCAALVAAGGLDASAGARASALAAEKRISEERAILALRLLGPKALLSALQDRATALLCDAFAWSDAAFELRPAAGDEPSGAPPEAALLDDAIALVHKGLTSYWSAERMVAAMGTAAFRYARPGPGLEAFCAGHPRLASLAALCARIDGRTCLADLARELGQPSAFAAAFLLVAEGVLEYADVPLADDAEAGAAKEPEAPQIEIVIAGRDGAGTEAPGSAVRADAGKAASANGDSLRRTILEKRQALEDSDPYEVLGVPRNADLAAIRRAYVTAAKSFHPDVLLRLGLDDVREEANAVFAAISKAHAVLSDPAARREYDESVGDGGTDELQRVATAETLYRKGEVLLRKGSFDEALQFLRPAVELCGDEAVYLEACGWALFKKQAPEPDEARALLERAVALDPASGGAHTRLASVLRTLGKERESQEHLGKARALGEKGRKGPSRGGAGRPPPA